MLDRRPGGGKSNQSAAAKGLQPAGKAAKPRANGPATAGYAAGAARVKPANKPGYARERDARQQALGGAQPRVAPGDPHLANAALADPMREQIAEQVHDNPSFYGSLVGMVNGGLRKGGFGISPASYASIMANVQQVHDGTISQSTAHFREAGSFAQDAVFSFANGHPVQGAVEGGGAVLNAVGGVGMSVLEGLPHMHRRPIAHDKQGKQPS